MKKLFSAMLLSIVCFAPVAFAAITAGMTQVQLDAEVKLQVVAGKSPADIAKAAKAAGIDAGSLTKALLKAGTAPAAGLAAVLGSYGNDAAASVAKAALDSGVQTSVIQTALTGNGISQNKAQELIAAAKSSSQLASSQSSTNTRSATSSGSSGGGSASGR